MRPLETSSITTPRAGWSAMRRFLPYLWPAGEPGLKARVVIAFLLVLLAKGVSLSTGFVYKAAIDRMSAGMEAAAGLAVALVVAYAGARFAGTFFE
ncbi:MAG: metal ABC transporter permease, partial [Allosphingosinicella sp.]